MKLVYWAAGKRYEKALADMLVDGAAVAGIDLVIKATDQYRGPEHDGALILGVVKREILWDHQAARRPLVLIDKGYCRDRIVGTDGVASPAWWRMCWQDVHPTAYLMKQSRPGDRWEKMGLRLRERMPIPRGGGHVLLIGSSAKFHETMRLTDPTAWGRQVVKALSRHGFDRVTYRPKPSWKYAEPIPGSVFDHGGKTSIAGALAGAHCSITYASIGCVDSISAGVPCITLGNGVSRPISSNFMKDTPDPFWAPRPQREQWAANLAYSNFTPAEIADGTAWKILKEQQTYAF